MSARTLVRSTVIGIIAMSAFGCTTVNDHSGHKSETTRPKSSTITNCTPTGTWQPVPSNFPHDILAEHLGVTEDAIVKGSFSDATCDSAIRVDSIGSPKARPVSVAGKPAPCLVMGTTELPRDTAETTKVMVVCPRS